MGKYTMNTTYLKEHQVNNAMSALCNMIAMDMILRREENDE